MMRIRLEPFEYHSGLGCPRIKECKKKNINCQVYRTDGAFPFADQEILDFHSRVQRFRDHMLAKITAFSATGRNLMLKKARTKGPELHDARLELAFMLRFYAGSAAAAWPALKVLLSSERLLLEPDIVMEAYFSICYWIERNRVPERSRADIMRSLIRLKDKAKQAPDCHEDIQVLLETIDTVIDALHRSNADS